MKKFLFAALCILGSFGLEAAATTLQFTNYSPCTVFIRAYGVDGSGTGVTTATVPLGPFGGVKVFDSANPSDWLTPPSGSVTFTDGLANTPNLGVSLPDGCSIPTPSTATCTFYVRGCGWVTLSWNPAAAGGAGGFEIN